MLYEIKQINFASSLYKDIHTSEDYNTAWEIFLEQTLWTNDSDILVLLVYGNPHYPNPYALCHYENNKLYRHMFVGQKTYFEEIDLGKVS